MEWQSLFAINFYNPLEVIMTKQEIKNKLYNLLRAEESILFKLSTDNTTDIEQVNFVIKRLFEMSEMILRLKAILKEIDNSET